MDQPHKPCAFPLLKDACFVLPDTFCIRSARAAALALLFVVFSVSSATAQDTAQAVLAELTRRADADAPLLAECDFVCKYRGESWTVHTRSFQASRTSVGGEDASPGYGIRAEPVEGLNVLFPSGAFTAIASSLDPTTLHRGTRDAAVRLLPSVMMDGVECKVLELSELPRAMHVGTHYPTPELEKATVTLYVHEGRIRRIAAQVTRKSTPGRPDAALFLETTPRYRHARTGAARPSGAPPVSQFTLTGAHAMVDSIAWSPDGKTVACMAFGAGCAMISVSTGKDLGPIPTPRRLQQVGFTPDGKYLVMPDPQEQRILYLDAATGKESKFVPVGDCNFLIISPDQSRALVWNRRDSRNRPRIVECSTGQTLCELPDVKSGTLQFSMDGKRFAELHGAQVTIRDAATGRELRSFASLCEQSEGPGSIRSWRMAFSPDSRLIAIGDASRGVSLYQLFDEEDHDPVRVYLYDAETGKLVQTLTGMNGAVRSLQFSPDGSLLAVGDADDRGEAPGENASVLLWASKNWKSLGAVAVQRQSEIAHMEFSQDSKFLATSAGRSTSVEIWSVPYP